MEPYQLLEQEWAKWNDLDPAGMVACSSGTAALHLAFEALQLPRGSKVIVPDFSMIACARAVTLARLEPVFVDCYADNLLMDMEQPESYSLGYRAVLLVHIYGRQAAFPCFCPEEVAVVEDLAEAHGIKPYKGSDAACWSFYKNKIIAGEEGGAVWFNNQSHADLARQLRNLGFTEAHDFNHVPRGHNYRMSNAHARLILRHHALQNPEWDYSQRCQIEGWYNKYCPEEWRMPPRDAVWVYDLLIPGMTYEVQNEVIHDLLGEGIAARHGFRPLRRQDEYEWSSSNGKGYSPLLQTNADKASREVIYLPVQPGITTEESCRTAIERIKRTLGL